FGTSISVWVALLALVLIISLIWMRQSMLTSFDDTITTVKGYYEEYGESNPRRTEDEAYFTERMDDLESDNSKTMIMASTMFGFALLIMLTNHSYMNRRSKESEIAANRDPMTGVMSKHAYLVKEKELDADIKEGKVRDFSVVVCDVNGLKKINDTLGHKAGDEYIRKASKMITEIFQHSTIYRVGGDEFLVILTGRDYSIREELMSTLHDTSVAHISTQDAVVSGGISDYTPEDHAFQDVFKRADDLMYEEKKRLKSLGAVTRDDESDAQMEQASSPVNEILEEKIINIRRHVLIVEDEPINQELLGHVLEDQFDVLYSADGEEALEIIKSRKDDIALVMLDLMLPVLSGYEVLRIMNADDELRQIPVIVLTVDSDAELDCLRLGAMDFIPKPYPIWEVVKARVNKCIELSENRGIIQSTERDSLTHLFNIDYFYRYVKMFDQHYWDMSMDAVVLNVNRFHMINERYGKNYGDSVLRRIGKKVREISREVGGVGCHKGADIFLIYCPHREDYGDILDKVSAGLQTDKGSSSRVRLRLGVYAEVDKNCEIERRFDRAKLAADSVKNTFAKPVGYYDEEMGKISLYKEHLLEDLAVAFETGQFEVYFQPKYDIRGDQPVLESAEALVRWNHPEMGMIMPNQFIPLMEENGLVLELDTFVWKQTGARLQEWKKKYGFSVPVSVNVSRVDMLMPDLKSIFKEILDTYELSGKDLILEITESAYTGDSEQVIATANELRSIDMGLRIEMDDFGTGYSSLGMLAHLPIDALKLDMSFISSAFAENMDVRMIELIIDIADYLHVPVIAEGVETEEQYMVLKAMGCNLVQGFYFSHPLPNEEFEKILLERKRQTVEPAKSSEGVNLDFFKELLGHFENVYYVDTSSGFYLEFFAGEDGSMQIVPGGKNFFKEAKQKLLTGVVAEDFERCLSLLEKENMMTWLDATEPIDISFTKKKEGQKVAYHLATIELLQKDSSHLVIGVGPAKEA
ncbi:MAG: EAL domain-containing protein, partial [Blautia sp.]|nr:EAL domain-containing protein [Blautia sp.]